MIVTLTPNPSVDRTITVPLLAPGEVNRAEGSRLDAGGKGVNVSRALSANGTQTCAVFPTGGPEGRLLVELLAHAQVPYQPVPVAGNVRMNVAVVEPDGTTTKVNEPGPRLSVDESQSLVDEAIAMTTAANWVVGCGSLPPGAPVNLLADLVRLGHQRGAKVAVDSSGPPMAAAVAAGPDLIKPNHEELEELVGRPLASLGDVIDAAHGLVARGVQTVVVSLGADGAVLVTESVVAHAVATIDAPLSTVAAGDCLLAGVLHELVQHDDPVAALLSGVRWGAAAVTLPGSEVPRPDDMLDIQVELSPDVDRTSSVQ